MDINTAFPSKFLNAADLQGKKVTVVISHFEIEEMNDGKKKLVAYFKGKQKGFTINKTNATTISDMFGPETNNWIGKAIHLFPARVDFQGKRVDAIRVEFVQPPPVRQKARQPAPQADVHNQEPLHESADDMNDEIPF